VVVWMLQGLRPTRRPDPNDGSMMDLMISSQYASSWLVRPLPGTLSREVPVLAILMSQDALRPPATRSLLPAQTTVIQLEGPHRWWASPDAPRSVLGAQKQFYVL
jgi:hypothetical protein